MTTILLALTLITEPIQYWTPPGTNVWVGDVTVVNFKVRYNMYCDPKADGTIFDAEIAGTRTMIARYAGRFLFK